MFRAALLAAALFASPIFNLAGQAASVLVPGSRVRVTAAPSYVPVVGTVVAQERDSLRLIVAGAPVALAHASFQKVEMSRGRYSNAGNGALIGLGLGGGTGLLLGVAAVASCGPEEWICPGPAAVPVMAILFGGLGAGLGALLGSGSSGERWDEVPRARVTLGPRRVGFGLSLAF